MMIVDHPNNTKRGGVCLYYKEHLPIIRRDDISNLQGCLVTEITKKINDVSSRTYIGLLAKIVNRFSLFVILLTFLSTTLIVSIQKFQ